MKKRKGFTLVELLIVIVILGIVAGLAFPVITAQIDRSRAAEALQALAQVKEAMVTYWITHGSTYVGAAFTNIGYDPGAAAAGQTPQFSYALTPNPTANAFTCVATFPAGATGAAVRGTISISNNGEAVRTGIFQ